jgi:hypothetical protein
LSSRLPSFSLLITLPSFNILIHSANWILAEVLINANHSVRGLGHVERIRWLKGRYGLGSKSHMWTNNQDTMNTRRKANPKGLQRGGDICWRCWGMNKLY